MDDNVTIFVTVAIVDGTEGKEYYPVINVTFDSETSMRWSLFELACTSERDARDSASLFLTAMVDMPESVYQKINLQLKADDTEYSDMH